MLERLMGEELREVPPVVLVVPGELRGVRVLVVVALGLLEVVGLALLKLVLALLELVPWGAFAAPIWVLMAAVVEVGVVHH